MAAPKKKRVVEDEMRDMENDEEDSELDEGDDMEEDEDGNDEEMIDTEVQVEFEARNPEDSDFHGIRKLLGQLFLKANINTSEMTDTIISQNYVGSVIRQCDEPEDDDDSDDPEDIFGIITAINLTERKGLDCVKQLKSIVFERCKQSCGKEVARWMAMLEDDSRHIGFLLNERFINIPPQIALPSFQSLWKEVERANKKNMKYNFSHYLMICKTYRLPQAGHKKGQTSDLMYTNQEEEFFADEAEMQFSYSVSSERDAGASGQWDEDDDEMEPFRTVLLIAADKIPVIMTKLIPVLSIQQPM